MNRHFLAEEGHANEGILLDRMRKNILLLGDSMRIGYCGYVREALTDTARVFFPDDNCRHTQYTYVSLEEWKNLFQNPERIDLVYWNNGHWDIAHWGGDERSLNTPEQYCDMLLRIAGRLRRLFVNAKVIFATTLPMNPNGSVGVNPRTNAEICRYNEAAKQCLKNRGVLIDDLYAAFEHLGADQYADYCHLTPEGFREVGRHAAAFLRANMD